MEITYDPALPISQHHDEIIAAIKSRQVLIIAGETGSGKTTQIPKMCIQAGRGARGLIGCTQPRRIAARAMAERVAEELHTSLGEVVGYQVRFQQKLSHTGIVKFMTDGILLAETSHDKSLAAYDTVIIDEAHERSLNIDFLMGYLKQLLGRRKDLRVIITSATIDTAKFSRYFDAARVIEVSGRSYPVVTEYQPLAENEEVEPGKNRDLYAGIIRAVQHLNRVDAMGDILVFLSGEREIREATAILQHKNFRHTEVLPLFARLPVAAQRKAFHPGSARRIILSTNVAETSLTVPRIRFVIDSGLARISRYSHRSRVQRLPVEAVSQAAANQRQGRCGRLGPGVCVRLFSENDFNLRPEFTEPEILRTSLASVTLRMLTRGLGAVEDFPFLDPPAPRMLKDAYQLLFELGAIDTQRRVVALGRQLARWPLDVRLARMLLEGAKRGCLQELLVLTSALTIQDPRERPPDFQDAADQVHARFEDGKSDFVADLKLWDYLRQQRRQQSVGQFRKLCKREFLNWQRVNEWFDLNRQLTERATEEGLRCNKKAADYAQIHRAILAGLLSHIGHKNPEDRSYTGSRSRTFHVFPGSGLFTKRPRWIMAAEIVETTKTWARRNAQIEPEWIEAQGSHLLRRHYSDPHWSRKQGRVLAWEQVTLFGLVIVERRRVNYGPVDPEAARKLFISAALVRGELDTHAGFMQNNQQVRAEIEELEHKRRRHDMLADESALFEFFDARIPADVCASRRFEQWLGQLGQTGRAQLYVSHDVLLREEAGEAPAHLYPDYFAAGSHKFPLTYHFEPGDAADGVTLQVPLERLNSLDPGQLQWLVPGLLRDKIIALIKNLPKPQRRLLTPVPQFADAALARLQGVYPAPLLPALAATLQDYTGMETDGAALDESRLPAHLRFRVEILDAQDNRVAVSRSLQQLQQEFGHQARRRFMDNLDQSSRRDGERQWVFGALPVSVLTHDSQGRQVRAWPALVDQQNAVGLRVFDTAGEAADAHHFGVLRLLKLQLASKLGSLRKQNGLSADSLLAWSAMGSTQSLLIEMADSSLALTVGNRPGGVRSAAEFEILLADVRVQIGPAFHRLANDLDRSLGLWVELSDRLNADYAAIRPDVCRDMRSQLDDMVYAGFLQDVPASRLAHYPRYLAAMRVRLAGVDKNPQRDAERLQQVEGFWQRYLQLLEQGREYDEAVDHFRWLIEEFRVSLFAQQLGTSGKVSVQRLHQAWRAVS